MILRVLESVGCENHISPKKISTLKNRDNKEKNRESINFEHTTNLLTIQSNCKLVSCIYS